MCFGIVIGIGLIVLKVTAKIDWLSCTQWILKRLETSDYVNKTPCLALFCTLPSVDFTIYRLLQVQKWRMG
jgi:hypothetical protein